MNVKEVYQDMRKKAGEIFLKLLDYKFSHDAEMYQIMGFGDSNHLVDSVRDMNRSIYKILRGEKEGNPQKILEGKLELNNKIEGFSSMIH